MWICAAPDWHRDLAVRAGLIRRIRCPSYTRQPGGTVIYLAKWTKVPVH